MLGQQDPGLILNLVRRHRNAWFEIDSGVLSARDVCWLWIHLLLQNCVEHFSNSLLTMSSTVFIICCLQSATLSWLADYGRLQLSNISCAGQIDLKIRSYLIASLTTSDSRNILFSCLCMSVCVIVLIQPLAAKTQRMLCYVLTAYY